MGDSLWPDRLYRFEKIDQQRCDTLKHGQLWLAKANTFNDLSDCALDVDVSDVDAWGRESLLRAAEALGVLPLLQDGQEILPHALLHDCRYMLELDSEMAREWSDNPLLQHAFKALFQKWVGATCFFAGGFGSPLMWAHYGANHTGMCVEYAVTGPCDHELFPVTYTSMPPRIGIAELLFSPLRQLRRVATTKTLDWAYENEFRIIKHGSPVERAQDGGVLFARPNWLEPKALLLGARMNPEQSNEFKEQFSLASALAEKLGIELKIMHHGRAGLVPVPISEFCNIR